MLSFYIKSVYMRLSKIYTFIFFILLAACKRDNVSNPFERSLQGEWKLVSVKEKSTGSIFLKPAGSSSDIIISFKGSNFSGHTLRNTFSDGTYTLNGMDLTFGSFSMTKVLEDDWGRMFFTVLHSCMLQSRSPCTPSKISFPANELIIESVMSYDLTLIRN